MAGPSNLPATVVTDAEGRRVSLQGSTGLLDAGYRNLGVTLKAARGGFGPVVM